MRRIGRRTVLLTGLAAGLATAACGPAGPGSVTISASGAAGMNPGPDGADRPLTLTVVQMRGTGAFDGADFFALQDPAAALGADFVKADTIALAPGGAAQKVIGLEAATTAIGVIAGFRNPGGKAFRAKAGVSPTANAAFNAEVTGSGLTLTPA